MADATTVASAVSALSVLKTNPIGDVIAAIAALGTAASGLVDVSKFARGGVSNAGFRFIAKSLAPYAAALAAASGPDWQNVLWANWINGVAKDQQKAIAKSLIHLGMSNENVQDIAVAGHVDPVALASTIQKINIGAALLPSDVNVIGRLDASIDALLDAGYERADQAYRNVAKAWAAVVAVILANWGAAILASVGGVNFTGIDILAATLIGAVSVPLAPIAKDLSSALQSAVKAMQAVRR